MVALTISKEKQEQIIKVANAMSEKQKRQFPAGEAALLGYGGVSLISRITGVSRTTIIHAMHELDNGDVFDQHGRQRAAGGGRTSHTDQNSELSNAIEEIVSGSTYGFPMTVLKWTTMSLRKISRVLKEKYFLEAGYNTVKKY